MSEEEALDWFDQEGDEAVEKNLGYERGLIGEGSRLTELVKEHLIYVQEEIPRRARRSDGYHASSIGEMCCRDEAFKRMLPRAKDAKKFSGDLLLRFQVGHAVHHHWQNKILGPAGILKGTWVCSRCTRAVKNSFMPTEPCKACEWQVDPVKHYPQPRSPKSLPCATGCIWPGGYEADKRDCRQCERGGEWQFQESGIKIQAPDQIVDGKKVKLDDPVVGSFDGILFFAEEEGGEPEDFIGEFKTKDVWAMKHLTNPEFKHVFQVNVYMLDPKTPNKSIIGYIDKNSGEMKTFTVRPDPLIIKKINQDVDLVRECVSAGELPNGVCTGRKDKRAKGCPYSDVCFLGLDTIDEILEHVNGSESDEDA